MSEAVCEKNGSKIALDKKFPGICVNQAEIEQLQKSPTFSSSLLISQHVNRPFFYFRRHGDSLEGFLGCKHSNASMHRSVSRIIETTGGPEEFFTNRLLAKVIDKFDLEGKYVRITYVGDEYTGYGHARKVYRVEKIPLTDRERIVVQTEILKTKGKSDGQEHATDTEAAAGTRGSSTGSGGGGPKRRSAAKPAKSGKPGK